MCEKDPTFMDCFFENDEKYKMGFAGMASLACSVVYHGQTICPTEPSILSMVH